MAHVAHPDAPGPFEVAAGTLLVAAPGLVDPNFHRTVVYVVEHGPGGSLGLVLNRPSETPLREILPSWAPLSARPHAVFVGGPVEAGAALCLATLHPGQDPAAVAGLVAVRGPVALVDLDGDPVALAPRVRGLRVFAGYAGWSGGQLAGEVARGDWVVVPALPDDVLADAHGCGLWARVLRRQGMPLALLATFPDDVRHN
jgi:putative transcriptional regulator